VAVRWRSTRKADLPLPRTVCTRPRTSTCSRVGKEPGSNRVQQL
jgi:hypothetical protein